MSDAGHVHDLQRLQNETLESIARGEPLDLVSDRLCRRAQALVPGVICSILTVDAGGRLHPLAGPDLPAAYSQALDGLPIGPCAGSCGTAAHRGRPVGVQDIATDPLWADYKALVLPLGLVACWSSPIRARDGRVIGTFAFYRRARRAPDDLERRIVDACVHVCAIALEHEEVRSRNHQLAFFDALTGLPNRARFRALLLERIEAASPFGLMLADIDNLKIVNDTLGHGAGDALIRDVAARLGRDGGGIRACRIGGDEFAVILDDCSSPEDLEPIAAGILARVAAPSTFGGNSLVPRITIGGAFRGADGPDAETLQQNADLALYHAKETGKGGFVRFDEGLRTSIMRRVEAVRTVGQALTDRRVRTLYQPIMRLDASGIAALEALPFVAPPPGSAVPDPYPCPTVADLDIACRTTDATLGSVAADLRLWLDAGIAPRHVGVNVSKADFERHDLGDRVAAAFARERVPLNHLMIEVAESLLAHENGGRTAEELDRLRRKGVSIVLDAFGAGSASLVHLLDVSFDAIKLDGSFVERLSAGRNGALVIEGLVAMAQRLRLNVMAAGIDTAQQAHRLFELGCGLGQGDYFTRPEPASAMTQFLRRFGADTRPGSPGRPCAATASAAGPR